VSQSLPADLDNRLAITGSSQQLKQGQRPSRRYLSQAKLVFEKAEARSADFAFGGEPGANGNFQESSLMAHANQNGICDELWRLLTSICSYLDSGRLSYQVKDAPSPQAQDWPLR
jgi:hypothetical protein